MERKRKKRIGLYWILLFCLLLLSVLAPTFWRGRVPALPHVARPAAEISLVAIEHQHRLHGFIGDEAVLPAAPALLNVKANVAVARNVAPPREQLDTSDLLAEPTTAVASSAGEGRIVPFGPLFADRVDGEALDEIFPPESPRIATALRDELRLQRTSDRLAMRVALASRNTDQQVATMWPRPYALVEQLQAISGNSRGERWAADVLSELETLAAVEAMDSESSRASLQRLEKLARQADTFVLQVRPAKLQADIRSAQDALRRRVQIWQQLQVIASGGEPAQFVSSVSDDELRRRIDQAIGSIPGHRAPPAWREFLRLDVLKRAIADGPVDIYDRAALASDVLERLHSPRLDEPQQELLDFASFHRLEQLLRQLATQPVDEAEVIFMMEQYEQTRAPTDGRRLAATAAKMRWSTDVRVAQLAHRLDDNYRAANVRLAITDDFLNRSLPKIDTKTEEVNEQVLTSCVSGQREVATKLSVRLIPDTKNWRVAMQADGKMTSETVAYADNAQLMTIGAGEFSASKLLLVDHHHVHAWRASAKATYGGELVGVSTSLDNVPLVSRIARSAAIDGYYENQWAAQQEIAARLQQRANKLLDEQTRESLADAEVRLNNELFEPLEKTGVESTPLKLTTSADRVVGEYRLAGAGQLSGHTPRPWAPKNAMLSLQIHESTINNILAGLRLDGRQGDVRDICGEIYDLFGREYKAPDSMPEDMTMLFADEDAIRVSMQDERVEVILKIAELRSDGRVWRDLLVRNYYAPDTSTLEAKLVRDSTVRLKGEQLGIRDQVALRAIFTKMFGDNREIAVVPSSLVDNAGLDGLVITQYVIRDGWLGIAIAPPHQGMNNDPDRDGPIHREARRSNTDRVIFE